MVTALVFARERALEFADATSERLTELRQALGPKHDQRNHEYYDYLEGSHICHASREYGTGP